MNTYESDSNYNLNTCPICKGTGKKRKICFGYPGYIDEDCICVKM